MKQQVTINEFVAMFIDKMRRIGYAEETIYRDHYRIIRRIARYYEVSDTLYYSVETTTEYLNLTKERADRGEISERLFRKIKMMCQKMNEYFITDHLSFHATKHGTVYRISAENERLIDCFISWKKYGTNIRYIGICLFRVTLRMKNWKKSFLLSTALLLLENGIML